MELTSYEPETAPSFLLPNMDEMVLLPIGDVQYGSPGCELDRFKRHIDWALGLMDRGIKVKFIGMGDYIDVASPSNRKLIKQFRTQAYDSVNMMIDEAAERHLDVMKKILEPTKGHWLGLLRGHHVWEFENGIDTDSMLAEFLETKYLGRCAMVHLRFEDPVQKYSATCKIWAHHGEGGGQSISAPISKVMQRAVPYWFAHLYLMGHYHSKGTQPLPWVDSYCKRNGEVILTGTTRYIVSTGGFLGGYAVGGRTRAGMPAAGYIEDAMLAPNTLGAPAIFIRPRRSHGRPTIDINVSC